MKRVIVLATLLIAGALSLAVTASQQPAAGAAAQAAALKVVPRGVLARVGRVANRGDE